MFNTTSTIRLVGALAAASSYVPAMSAAAAADAQPISARAVAQLQQARIEIYCGHNNQAVAGIRAARRQLHASSMASSSPIFATLDQASWLTRHDQHLLAEHALDKALDQLATAGTAS
jgi:hypothetical protein